MANEDDSISQQDPNPEAGDSNASDSDSDYDSSYDYEYEEDYDYRKLLDAQKGGPPAPAKEEHTPEYYIAQINEILDSRRKEREEREAKKEKEKKPDDKSFDFPKDYENWQEEDLNELWADLPPAISKPGWDPVWADESDWRVMKHIEKEGGDPPIAPFYLPYRPPCPPVPHAPRDLSTAQGVIEELDKIEEFLTWVSFIFPDGSSYEGTVWDDVAQGKGVYIAEQGLVKYEGEWLRNNMEGHGVSEVDIPDIQPVPGSKLEAKMRANGEIITRDFMPPEDREWLEKDIEDAMLMTNGDYEIPFYEKKEWTKYFDKKPEVGRYRYAGQWKNGKMHGCGVYEMNERILYGRFYFGEFVDGPTDCDEEISALHAGIAEVAAAKARMFVNKPDGMVREDRGPYSDPQHHYFYEEEDAWMAPGFVHQFYEVPDFWKTYVEEIDKEREMWLNSFYKAPLRLPMPPELQYWWENDKAPEFVILDKKPEPDPEDPSKLIYTEDPVIFHTGSGLFISCIEDEEHGFQMMLHPNLEEGKGFDLPENILLPLGFDDFYGKETVVRKPTFWERLVTAVENRWNPMLDNLEKWAEEKKKTCEMKKKQLREKLELAKAELSLEEAIQDMQEEEEEEEEEEDTPMATQKEEGVSVITDEDQKPVAEAEEEAESEAEEEEEEEDEDYVTPSSFGSVTQDEDLKKKGNGPGESRFSSCSMSMASFSLLSAIPSRLQLPFPGWKTKSLSLHSKSPEDISGNLCTVSFPANTGLRGTLRAKSHANPKFRSVGKMSHLSQNLSSRKRREKMPIKQSHGWLHAAPETDSDSILSLHTEIVVWESLVEKALC